MNRMWRTTARHGVALAAALLAGCQTYERQGVQLEQHRAAFLARTPESPSVQQFAEQLAKAHQPSPAFDLSNGIEAAEAEVIALVFNADLRMARMKAGVALASAENGALWEDPVLGVDLQQVVQGAGALEVLSMVRLTIPISGRLDLEKERLGAEYEAELARVAQEEWRVRIEVRRMWTEWSALEVQLQATRDFIARFDALLDIVKVLEKAEELPRIETRLFRIEHATRSADAVLLESKAREAALKLRQLMGLAPQARVALNRDGIGPSWPAGKDIQAPSMDDVGAHSPLMLVTLAEYEAAERTLALEVRKQIPDLQIGPGYGKLDGPDEFMMGISLPLPLLNANRQAIAEARARREVARAGAQTTLERLFANLASAQVRLDAAKELHQTYETSVVPLVDLQYAETRRVAELGEVDTFVMLESLTRQQDAKLDYIEVLRQEALARIDIQEVTGARVDRTRAGHTRSPRRCKGERKVTLPPNALLAVLGSLLRRLHRTGAKAIRCTAHQRASFTPAHQPRGHSCRRA